MFRVHNKMPRLNPLRKLYDSLDSKLNAEEVNRLKNLLGSDQLQKKEAEQLHNAMDIFLKLEEKGHISLDNLELLRELFQEIQRSPLVEEVDKFLRENGRSRQESHIANTTSSIQITDTQHLGHGDVSASSERSSAAVHREMARGMRDPDGETTSVQHHIDNHNLRREQYEQTVQQEQHRQEQDVQEQVPDRTGLPPSKCCKCSSNPTELQEQKYPGIVEECEKKLKSHYHNLSHILPFPWWDGANRLRIENVYTELELQTKAGTKRDFPTGEIFSPKHDTDSHTDPKRVLIEGDPGYGKSTFCKKIAYDWAEGKTEYLNCFKLLFCFELKDMLECNDRNIRDAIFDQLSWSFTEDDKRQELWHFIQCNQTKVCFVFDGLDEVPTKSLPKYFQEMVRLKRRLLPDCPVIVTSRKIRDSNTKQMYDTQLLIKGFGIERAKAFVEKHLKEMNANGQHLAEVNSSDFMKEVEMSSHKNVLFNFMQSPLNTLMLCDIWIHASKLPHTLTELYEEIINYIVKRYKENNACNENFDEDIKQALLDLGKKSYTSLKKLDGHNYFGENDISHIKHIRELGLLTKLSVSPPRYDFYHLTFKEYFAAMYLAELSTKDRSEFANEIDFSGGGIKNLKYNDTLLKFIGGGLRDNVVEMFKVWEEKHLYPFELFDPRPILYESCCRSTEVLKHCAQFLPKELTVDFNTMASQSDSNSLDVNTTVLQCSNARSYQVHFILSASNADTIEMYKKCYDALQKNPKTFYIEVTIHLDLNEYQTKGRHIQDFTFLEKAKNDFLQDLKQVTIKYITLEISNYKNSSDRYIQNIMEGIFRSSIKKLSIQGLPLSNFTFFSNVHRYLYNINLFKSVDVTFYDAYFEWWANLDITANFRKFKTCYRFNRKNFDILGLCNFLSEFASANNERVSQSHSLVMNSLHYGNLDTVREVHTVLQSNKSLKSVDMTFYDDYPEWLKTRNLKITANFGKFKSCFQISLKNFDILGLCNFLTKFASANNERVFLDIDINSDCTDTSDITVLLQRGKSVHIGQILLNFQQSGSLSQKDIYSNISSIVEALSLVSANELVIRLLPLGNLDFVGGVHAELLNNKLLKSVDMTFFDDSLEKGQICKLKIKANFGIFKTCIEINDKNFDIFGFQTVLTQLASDNNDRVSLNIEINYNVSETIVNYDIREMLPRLKSVNIGEIVLRIFNLDDVDMDTLEQVPSIVQSLSQVSANKLIIIGLLQGSLQSPKDAIKFLCDSSSIKSVEMIFFNGIVPIVPKDFGKYSRFSISINRLAEEKNKIIIKCQRFTIIIAKYECSDVNILSIHNLLSKYAATSDEKVSVEVSTKVAFHKTNVESYINDTLAMITSVFVDKMTILVFYYEKYHKKDICEFISSVVNDLPKHSIRRLVIEGLPLVENLKFMKDVHRCLADDNLLKSVEFTFHDGHESFLGSKLEVIAKFGKFKTCYTMRSMNFNIMSLHQSLVEFVSFDSGSVKMAMQVKYDLEKSTGKDIERVFANSASVDIERVTLNIIQGHLSTEDVQSHTSDVIQSLSQVSAKEFVIHGLLSEDSEFIKTVHSQFVKSVPNKLTHMSFQPLCLGNSIKFIWHLRSITNVLMHMPSQPLCLGTCGLTIPEHSTIVIKNPKHTSEFVICKSKFDIISLYQELQKDLLTVNERIIIDAHIKSTYNTKDVVQCVIDASKAITSKAITFNNVEYVEKSHEPVLDVLVGLAEVNTQQFSYKTDKSLQCNFMKSVCNAMLQCQSAQTIVISSTERCEDIEISVNIEKLVSDGLIIHGVKFKDKTVTIQGSYGEGIKTSSKTIEVEFALNHMSNIDWSYDDVEVNHAILEDSNALTKRYIKVCYVLQTQKISGLKSLCIEYPDILSDELCTYYLREILIENVHECILALPNLAKVIIVGGKITSMVDSSETWVELFTKESLEMFEFKDCDLNDSCQSAIIDSVIKADECRCSQLRITLCDSLSSQNVDLMKEKLLAGGFVLSDTGGSASQGDIVFSLKGKYVSIVAISCKETN